MVRLCLVLIGGWGLACSALLAAFSTFDFAWALLLAGALGATAVWLGVAVFLTIRKRWTRTAVLCWSAWPAAVAVVALLHVTHLPLVLRVAVSGSALDACADAARKGRPATGRHGLVLVFDACVEDGHVWLRAGGSLGGITGLVRAADGAQPSSHPDYAATEVTHLYGPWWYFKTRT